MSSSQNPRSLKDPGASPRPSGRDRNSGVFLFAEVNSGAKFNLKYGSRFLREGVARQACRRSGKSIDRGERSIL